MANEDYDIETMYVPSFGSNSRKRFVECGDLLISFPTSAGGSAFSGGQKIIIFDTRDDSFSVKYFPSVISGQFGEPVVKNYNGGFGVFVAPVTGSNIVYLGISFYETPGSSIPYDFTYIVSEPYIINISGVSTPFAGAYGYFSKGIEVGDYLYWVPHGPRQILKLSTGDLGDLSSITIPGSGTTLYHGGGAAIDKDSGRHIWAFAQRSGFATTGPSVIKRLEIDTGLATATETNFTIPHSAANWNQPVAGPDTDYIFFPAEMRDFGDTEYASYILRLNGETGSYDTIYFDQSYAGLGPWGSPATNLLNDLMVFMPTRGQYGNAIVLDPHISDLSTSYFQVSTATGTANAYQNIFRPDAPGVAYTGTYPFISVEGVYAMNAIISVPADADKINRMVLNGYDSVSDAIDMEPIDALDYTSWTQPVAPPFVVARKGIPSIYMIGGSGYGVRVAKITRKEDGGWQVGFISMG